MMEFMQNGLLKKIIVYSILTILSIVISNCFFGYLSKKTKKVHYKFFNEVLNTILIFMAIFVLLLQQEGTKEIGSQIAKGGALIIAILSFAAQKALGNVISGVFLSGSKAFKLGDKIRIVKNNWIIAEGIVEDITLRQVVIKTYDKKRHIVPNSLMDDSVIINMDVEETSNTLFFTISFQSDIEKALQILEEECKAEELIINQGNAYIKEYAADGVLIGITVYADDSAKSFLAQTRIYKKMLSKFKENNIDIPYNTITIQKEEA